MSREPLNEQSGQDAASLAGRVINAPESARPREIKKLAASVLSQRRDLRVLNRSQAQAQLAVALVLPPQGMVEDAPPELQLVVKGRRFAIDLDVAGLRDLATDILRRLS